MNTLLTADIGGTHCRFGLFIEENGLLVLERVVWQPTVELTSTEAVLGACAASLGVVVRKADALILALAGPVLEPLLGHTTNAALSLDLRIAQDLPKHCAIINDFTAQAYACLTEVGRTARRILPSGTEPSVPSHATRSVLGAGTGFGTASLVYDPVGGWCALPAEGGHMSFAFVGEEETAFRDFLLQERESARKETPFAHASRHAADEASPVECEEVLSGQGLVLVHRFLTGERLSAAEVGRDALSHDSATLRLFARFYGRMCRNWALATLCRGGLYIAGGLAAKNPLTVTSPAFSTALYTPGAFGAWLRVMPVFLMDCENSGLWGAARYGQRLLHS